MYICQTIHVACMLSNFVFCTVTLPRRCCHLCCIFISLSLVLSAASSHTSHCFAGYASLALVRHMQFLCSCRFGFAFYPLRPFFPLLYPVFTICILTIHFKYFYNPLNYIFNSVNYTKFTFCSNTQSACGLFVLLQPTVEKIISFQMTFIFLPKPF